MIGSVRRWMHRKFTAEKNNAAPASQPDFTRMMRRTADATFVSGREGKDNGDIPAIDRAACGSVVCHPYLQFISPSSFVVP